MDGPTKVVYVGSIPYDHTEEQMLDIFKSVGPVANIRLVFDKDTGKSKGFGFVEYHDEETAASAVRNLNNYSIGPRALKVAFSHETPVGGLFKDSKISSDLPPLPQGPIPARGVSGNELISQTIDGFSQERKVQVIVDMKTLISNNPTLATDLLKAAPQLSFAVVQTLSALQLITPQQITNLTPDSNPASESHAPAPAPAPVAVDPQQAALIKQVVQLTDDQINALPADQKETILTLKAKVKSGEIKI
ncbi:Rna15p [Sugiyamaella lignohabitans]|uniref:Rna15p n=1 Tax=Sugiyamaella lignohabitans TaxID=796027 RepID=A0A167CJL6_9ASCO|nr:Rna15p [Sugiyamaella lignohabitans]ANB11785.1 Rna15p [Sugiyamaella lignohabitans]